jgi:hypothetical protein
MPRPKVTIPLCSSEFLQDFSIEFGRQLKPIRYESTSIDYSLQNSEVDGKASERLTIWLRTGGVRTTISLWDNRRVWIDLTLMAPKHHRDYHISFYPDCSHLSPLGIVGALRQTKIASASLSFGESPISSLRKIWRYDGQFETNGILKLKEKGLAQ